MNHNDSIVKPLIRALLIQKMYHLIMDSPIEKVNFSLSDIIFHRFETE